MCRTDIRSFEGKRIKLSVSHGRGDFMVGEQNKHFHSQSWTLESGFSLKKCFKKTGKKGQTNLRKASCGFCRTKRSWTYSSVKTLWKLSELCQRVSKWHVWMEAVEENADYCLGGTRVVNNLRTHNLHKKGQINPSLQRQLYTPRAFWY